MPAFNNPPWHPMSNPVDLKTLGKLIEELGEATQAASRCLIQGMDGAEPTTTKPNREWLEDELADCWANIELVIDRFGLDFHRMHRRAENKKGPLRAWHEQA